MQHTTRHTKFLLSTHYTTQVHSYTLYSRRRYNILFSRYFSQHTHSLVDRNRSLSRTVLYNKVPYTTLTVYVCICICMYNMVPHVSALAHDNTALFCLGRDGEGKRDHTNSAPLPPLPLGSHPLTHNLHTFLTFPLHCTSMLGLVKGDAAAVGELHSRGQRHRSEGLHVRRHVRRHLCWCVCVQNRSNIGEARQRTAINNCN